MSQSNYFKNFILCGDVDFFCLLCSESFKLPEDVTKHIRWENHRKHLKGRDYFPKYCKDRIYKVENQFYCELCNTVLQSFEAVGKHIHSETHKTNKSQATVQNKPCSQENNGSPKKIEVKELFSGEVFVIADMFVLKKQEWHGVLNNHHCYLCDVAVKDFQKHVSCNSHIVNLMAAKIILEDGKYYRKIHDETLFCFKCKRSFQAQSVNEHWQKEEHSTKPDFGHETLKSFKIYDDSKVAVCSICNLVPRYHFETLTRHHETHANTIGQEIIDKFSCYDPGDRGKLRAELKQYGKQYCIKLNRGGRKGYCKLCEVYIVPHMNNFKEHVNCARHQGFMEHKGLVKKKGKKAEKHYKTKPSSQFIRSCISFHTKFFVLINTEICISVFSYSTICMSMELPNALQCYVCDITMKSDSVKDHLTSSEHKQKLESIPTITTIKGELIREVQPNIYHCGYCNTVYPGSSVLERHLLSTKHALTRGQIRKDFTNMITRDTPRYSQLNVNSIDFLD